MIALDAFNKAMFAIESAIKQKALVCHVLTDRTFETQQKKCSRLTCIHNAESGSFQTFLFSRLRGVSKEVLDIRNACLYFFVGFGLMVRWKIIEPMTLFYDEKFVIAESTYKNLEQQDFSMVNVGN